ncbi:hypothetical protein CCAX7_59110 [Capsulimonas corticalis]|uniref:Uncharacterized protein n=1 Tax=Capsulimonas corticalis TaxID=2219043 RepID=A0A402CZX6_9BACT|nr:hypothetical protein [Capsulimonas corticalis]BDI33860.1 hypothetical protein CCAX7_59110 [Capsulimonas corticalis]
MSNILIVDDEGKLSQRFWPVRRMRAGAEPKENSPNQQSTTWRDYAAHAHEYTPGDVVVFNLETPGAPTLQEAVRLRKAQPDLGFVYVVDIMGNVPKRTLTALSQPGVTWVSSTASDRELRLRVRGVAELIQESHRRNQAKLIERPQKATLSFDISKSQKQSPWMHVMPELHNQESGRLDSARIAEWFGMPLKTLAGLLGRGYATVHKTPDSVAVQSKLKVFLRIASALSRLAGSPAGTRIWLNTPNPDLENNQTPMSAIEMGEQEIIAELLEDALAGQPG